MEEVYWAPIPGYESYYEVSNYGEIKSQHKKNFNYRLKQRIDRAGYYTVRLAKKDQTKTWSIHKLVAITFIPNLENKTELNHKNGVKTDNRLINLEWVTHSENMLHAYDLKLCSRNTIYKKVLDICSGEMFKSIKDASDRIGIPYSTCKNYLNGRRINKTCLRLVA